MELTWGRSLILLFSLLSVASAAEPNPQWRAFEKRDKGTKRDKCFDDIDDKWEIGEWWDEDELGYDKTGYVNKAPLSYACYTQCYFKKIGVTNEDGVPTSEGYARLAKKTKGEKKDNFARIRDLLKQCETDYKRGETKTKVEIDKEEGIREGYNEKACVDSLSLTACVLDRLDELPPKPKKG